MCQLTLKRFLKKYILSTILSVLFLVFIAKLVQSQINGAVYFPASAYNVDRLWMEYNSNNYWPWSWICPIHQFKWVSVCGNPVDDPINRILKDPLRAWASKSPPEAITTNSGLWQPHRDHITWFFNRFKNDNRLIGIELLNEPSANEMSFARDIVRTAVSNKGSIPITVGTLDSQFLSYVSDGVDILQFHNNFPANLSWHLT